MMVARPISMLIVDDEKEACDNLINIINEYVDNDVNIVGVAYETAQAEILIKKLKPDAVFLDIEMHSENAFEFLERINPHSFEIIFITAFDEFAIRAFKLNAVDYILKPICIDELTNAIERLKERLTHKIFFAAHNVDVLNQIATKEQPGNIILRSLNRVEIVDFKDIYAIEGQGNYSRIHFRVADGIKDITTSNTISYYEEILPDSLFYRVHKSYLVNCMHVHNILAEDNNYAITVKHLDKIPVSRRRYTKFIRFLKAVRDRV